MYCCSSSLTRQHQLQAHCKLTQDWSCLYTVATCLLPWLSSLRVCQSRSAKILTQAVCQHVVSSCSHQNTKFGMLYKTHLTSLYNQLIAKSIEVLSWRRVRLGSAAWAARLAQEIEIV
ncbi:hypothetical protein FIBSPDRAFT_572916 [Athelia psychrophila]|uniref:Uncharacterized protein n=1 Tax=Athelia psychrophila TaxID=1759441 RepID=A0A166HNJ3_9AGAM|nr:hypothetical protein FIBSPDRAFT_572916 [Fibularhizoctonia sp. CBS 109695]